MINLHIYAQITDNSCSVLMYLMHLMFNNVINNIQIIKVDLHFDLKLKLLITILVFRSVLYVHHPFCSIKCLYIYLLYVQQIRLERSNL